MENKEIKIGELIDCQVMFDAIIKSLGDLSETKKFYIFYASNNINTISYIKSMKRITKYNIEIKIINMNDISNKQFLNVSNEINNENLKYIILKPIDDSLLYKLKFTLSDNEIDANNELTIDAVMYILKSLEIEPQAFLMIGRHLGKQMALKMLDCDYSPLIAHSKTSELEDIAKYFKLIISTTGCNGLIKANMVEKGSVVIDVGLGDIDEDAYDKCLVTPKVNGVGLITTAMLIKEIRS